MTADRPSVLFVCVKNGGKSQMAAALMRQAAGGAVAVHSAGTRPGSALNEGSRAAVEEVGATVEGEHPKPIDPALLDSVDRVVLVGTEAQLERPGTASVEVWATDEPSERGIEGAERMRLIREDLAGRVQGLLAELTGDAGHADGAATATAAPSDDAGRPSVMFVCVHNAGRSQMAAAYARHLSGGAVEVRSAGSAPADTINPAVHEAMLEEGIDLTGERPKILTPEAVHASDAVITMGCGDACPFYPGKRYEDWKLEDPARQGVDAVRPIRDEIRARVAALLMDLGVDVVA